MRTVDAHKNGMSSVRKWWISIRPYSLSASVIPVIFGATMALNQTQLGLNALTLTLSILAMLILQSGANILNDIHDYQNGLDRLATPVSGGIVRGLITTRQAWTAVWLLFICGSLLGIIISLMTTLALLFIGIPGVAIGWFYSHGRRSSLKFQSLGDAAVFLSFGILGTLGSWMAQTLRFSLLPIIWSLPISFLVIAILHANNWRDSKSDLAGGVRTVATHLGDRAAMVYYGVLIFSPYIILLLLMALPQLFNQRAFPAAGMITLLSLPLAIRLFKKARNRHQPVHPHDFIALDGASAQLNLLFGLLCILSLLIDHFT